SFERAPAGYTAVALEDRYRASVFRGVGALSESERRSLQREGELLPRLHLHGADSVDARNQAESDGVYRAALGVQGVFALDADRRRARRDARRGIAHAPDAGVQSRIPPHGSAARGVLRAVQPVSARRPRAAAQAAVALDRELGIFAQLERRSAVAVTRRPGAG